MTIAGKGEAGTAADVAEQARSVYLTAEENRRMHGTLIARRCRTQMT